jgi:hypothetical protein
MTESDWLAEGFEKNRASLAGAAGGSPRLGLCPGPEPQGDVEIGGKAAIAGPPGRWR